MQCGLISIQNFHDEDLRRQRAGYVMPSSYLGVNRDNNDKAARKDNAKKGDSSALTYVAVGRQKILFADGL